MQTFLPYSSFEESAAVLDMKRLGKQRVEARQILQTLLRGSHWQNHPAVKMWRGFEPALALYHDTMIREWKRRGYNNTMPELCTASIIEVPTWLRLPEFHKSHRSNLLRKNREYYSKFFDDVSDDLPYVWNCNCCRSESNFDKRKIRVDQL